jgi:hypothetical protein
MNEPTPEEQVIEATRQLGFLNCQPCNHRELVEQLARVRRWYDEELRPALARLDLDDENDS